MPLISNEVELLPLLCSKGAFYGINVVKVLDVIDYNNSVFRRFRDSTRIMAFQKYSFCLCDELKEANIIKIIDEPIRRAFVSERFKNIINKYGLTGFNLRLIWDDGKNEKAVLSSGCGG